MRNGAGQHGDTTRASARIAEIRETEHLALKVPRQLISPVEEYSAWVSPRFRTIVDDMSARPFQPAAPGARPNGRMPIAGLIEANDRGVWSLAISPAALAVVALCGCRWPIGNPSDENFHFCNKKRAAHFYCDDHERKSRKRQYDVKNQEAKKHLQSREILAQAGRDSCESQS